MSESEPAETPTRAPLHDEARCFAAERVMAVGCSRVAWWLVLAALLVLGIWFRFAHLDRKVYSFDEVGTSLRIAGYTLAELRKDRRLLSPEAWLQYVRVDSGRGPQGVMRILVDDVHPPLYFLLARWWGQWLGSDVWRPRSLSAVISLLAFPSLYWLCRELFASRAVAWMAVGLLTISPVHVLYAQEARPYSLWIVMILSSSAALLRALRLGSPAGWLLYALVAALALYTNYLAVLLIGFHGAYVVITEGIGGKRRITAWGLAAAAATVAFLPWLLVVHTKGFAQQLNWVSLKIPLWAWLQRWPINLSSIFFDVQVSHRDLLFDIDSGHDAQLRITDPSSYVVALLVLLVAYAVYVLCREGPRRAQLFIAALCGPALVMLLSDIVSGGQRSTIGRFLLPLYLALEMAVAYCLAERVWGVGNRTAGRLRWRAITLGVVAAGVLSCSVASAADTWWTKYTSYADAEVARIVNRSPSPLVLVGGAIALLELSHLAHPAVRLKQARGAFVAPEWEQFSDVFVFWPVTSWLSSLAERPDVRLQPVFVQGQLYRLERTAAASR